MTEIVKYFAYGSNLHPVRLSRRVPSSRPLGMAELEGHVLRFHKVSPDGSGKCNIVHTGDPADRVLGALYEMRLAERRYLDAAESLGAGYNHGQVRIRHGAEIHEVFTYIADPAYIDERARPYNWYRDLVLHGARHHGLPEHYLRLIEGHEVVEDPDGTRAEHHFRIVHSITLG